MRVRVGVPVWDGLGRHLAWYRADISRHTGRIHQKSSGDRGQHGRSRREVPTVAGVFLPASVPPEAVGNHPARARRKPPALEDKPPGASGEIGGERQKPGILKFLAAGPPWLRSPFPLRLHATA